MLAKKLIQLRGSKTQQEVADSIGISRARYAHYETGRNEPDIKILMRLADYFRVSVDELIGRTEFVKEEKEPYNLAETRDLFDLLGEDPESLSFWLAYAKASPEKRKEYLRTWKMIDEQEKSGD
jgi:transcriptional regulator with XRE-family HTH domain